MNEGYQSWVYIEECSKVMSKMNPSFKPENLPTSWDFRNKVILVNFEETDTSKLPVVAKKEFNFFTKPRLKQIRKLYIIVRSNIVTFIIRRLNNSGRVEYGAIWLQHIFSGGIMFKILGLRDIIESLIGKDCDCDYTLIWLPRSWCDESSYLECLSLNLDLQLRSSAPHAPKICFFCLVIHGWDDKYFKLEII